MAVRAVLRRKGIFLTIAALLLAVLSVLAFTGLVTVTEPRQRAIDIRILTLNNFLVDTEKDMARAIFISGFRAILSLTDNVIQTGEYLADTESAFLSAVMNATYKNDTLDEVVNATLVNWSQRIRDQANDVGANFTLTILGASVEHYTPWDIRMNFTAQLVLEDLEGLASFNTTHTASATLSIIGLEDPIYALNTLARVTNRINKTPITDFVVANSTTNLQVHANNSYYVNHSDGPSFLMRLEGNETGSSPYGIESMVYLPELTDQGLSTFSRSVIDHVYFTNKSVTSCRVTNMPSWFYIDSNHSDEYEVEGLDQSPCP
jgi:hypothetical protein